MAEAGALVAKLRAHIRSLAPQALPFVFWLSLFVSGVLAARAVAVWLWPLPRPEAMQVASEGQPSLEALAEQAAKTPVFGAAPKKDKAPPPPPKPSAPPVQARLLGTVVGEPAAAIIAVGGQKQRVFFVGEEIAPGVRLARVGPDFAELDRGGEIQRLELEHAKPPAGAAPAPSPRPAPVRAHRPPPRVPMLRRPVTRGWVRQQMNNLPQLLTQARVIPHFTDGKADGFVITEIKPGSVFEQIGLQNGDLIKRVNGQTITTPQQAMALYQALDRANAIEVVVERQGQEITLHYDLQ